MLLPRLKLAVIFDRAFHAMADMQWRMLGGLIVFHALSSWLLLAMAGEAELRAPATFFYWYATTAYTVGYGDLSPQGAPGGLSRPSGSFRGRSPPSPPSWPRSSRPSAKSGGSGDPARETIRG